VISVIVALAGALLEVGARTLQAQAWSCTVNTSNLNVREGPGKGYEVVTIWGQGTEVNVTHRNSAGKWLFGSGPGANGWVSAKYMACPFDVNVLPVDANMRGSHTGPAGGSTPVGLPVVQPTPPSGAAPRAPGVVVAAPTNTPIAPSALRPRLSLDWAYVPGGDFVMGSTEDEIWQAVDLCNQWQGNCQFDWFASEMPRRIVYLPDYGIHRKEVTNDQYQGCVRAGACNPSQTFAEHDGIPFDPAVFQGRYPVVGVNWYDAQSYCSWAGARLPTEEEWEKAARGADGRIYPWGWDLDLSRANLGSGSLKEVARDRSGLNPFELHDMSGNVFEWTSTSTSDGRYVLKGGSWSNFPFRGRAADRGTKLDPSFANYDIGFRCVK
jgi:formylglycine-generating enzyme required for sulfatase activity